MVISEGTECNEENSRCREDDRGRGLWRWLCTHRQGGKCRGTFGTGAKVVGAFRYEYVSEGPFVNMHM